MVGHVGAGHLVITTGQGLPKTDEAQTQFITELTQAGIAGMVISVGKRFHQIPPAIITTADQCHFPIITLPWHKRFVDITRVIHEQVISRQYALLKKSDHIRQTFSQIVLEGGKLPELAKALAQLVERSVTIEGPNLKLLAYADFDEADLARQQIEDESDEKAFWWSKSPQERWQAIEIMRQIIYGYSTADSPRFQRVLTVTQHLSG